MIEIIAQFIPPLPAVPASHVCKRTVQYYHCSWKCLLALPTECEKQGLCNGTVSVCLSHLPAAAARGRFAGGQEISVDCCIAAPQQQMRAVPHLQLM